MSITLQDHLADSVLQAAEDLKTALMRVPEDKRTWSPLDQGRTALDQVAECALLDGYTASVVSTKKWPEDFDIEVFFRDKAALITDQAAVLARLEENATQLASAIRAVANEDLDTEIATPWGAMTLLKIANMSYWNMSYHQGQINYIASLVGCL
jgi:hypothetical protein